jgi:peptidoglycan/xylan/chitin deacetylase (PgdA/CDA1 family)
MRGQLAILMLHRFADAERGIEGHDPRLLRRALETLRRDRTPLVSLRRAVDALRANEPIEGVVVTVDDGYDDFDTVAAPVFAAFDCPVTVFLTTGFLDGAYWFWWDKLRFALANTSRAQLVIPRAGAPQSLSLDGRVQRHAALASAAEWLKSLPQAERASALDGLLAVLGVTPPTQPPRDSRPLTWTRVRNLAHAGVDFGPHTVNHPSLATTDEVAVSFEISASYQRLRVEIADPAPVFCYPYGLAADVSASVAKAVEAAGLRAAVTAQAGYAGGTPATGVNLYQLPRFVFPDDTTKLRQLTSGFEQFKTIARGMAAGASRSVRGGG